MFSSRYLTIAAKIRSVVVTELRMAIVGDEDGGCARIAISPSFLICCTLFADLQMLAHFRILFQPCSSLGIISTAKFFFKSLL